MKGWVWDQEPSLLKGRNTEKGEFRVARWYCKRPWFMRTLRQAVLCPDSIVYGKLGNPPCIFRNSSPQNKKELLKTRIAATKHIPQDDSNPRGKVQNGRASVGDDVEAKLEKNSSGNRRVKRGKEADRACSLGGGESVFFDGKGGKGLDGRGFARRKKKANRDFSQTGHDAPCFRFNRPKSTISAGNAPGKQTLAKIIEGMGTHGAL